MIEKVDFVVDEQAERAGYHKMTTIIDITLARRPDDPWRGGFRQGQPDEPDEL